ncbi:MAG: N-terminal cleavage protein [Phycisphaerales bacterium]|nr:N-terminal cleavage protein [Phycisphaerales bacterium]
MWKRGPQHAPPDGGPGGRRRRRTGGTLVQLLVVCAIVAVLLAIMLPVAGRVRAAARGTQCLANLRGIGLAFRMYAAANGQQLPTPAYTQVPWERSLQAYASADAFVCPGDEELAPATFSSYDWRDTGLELTTLAGKNPYMARGDAVVAFDALPGWHGTDQMNAVRADGSAGPMAANACVADLRRAP